MMREWKGIVRRWSRSGHKLLMNKGKCGILERGLRRRLSRRPRAPRKDPPRPVEEASAEEIGDREVTVNGGLVYAALRVWELKHGFGD
jgi:hypothetical protein